MCFQIFQYYVSFQSVFEYPFGFPVLLNRKPVLNISFVPLSFFLGTYLFYDPGFTTMKQNSCRSDCKTMDEGGGRILLGDDTGMLRPFNVQCV